MGIRKCDICQKPVYMCAVRDIYQTEKIKQICSECSSEANKILHKLQNEGLNWQCEKMKEYLLKKKALTKRSEL